MVDTFNFNRIDGDTVEIDGQRFVREVKCAKIAGPPPDLADDLVALVAPGEVEIRINGVEIIPFEVPSTKVLNGIRDCIRYAVREAVRRGMERHKRQTGGHPFAADQMQEAILANVRHP